ncbi:hypothetical protein HQO46_15800 [Rhodococcus fascians]|nr:hypothetical protein [Rhodococcus fascians]MBY4237711.1 hypothetical protein [Rhodococcus fascians]
MANYKSVYSAGETIPVSVSVIQTAKGEILTRYNEHGFGDGAAWGTNDTSPVGDGAWDMSDFPLTVLVGDL